MIAIEELRRPIVISGASGAGKSTLLKKLFAEYPDTFGFSVSHTTRKPRPGEVDGKDYHFVTDRVALEKEIADGKFIESAVFSGNLYGTSIESVQRVREAERTCILDIDLQGVKSVKKTSLNARYIFIQPPSMEILEKRLRDRGTETEDSLSKRLSAAKEELAFSRTPGFHDVIIVNDNVDVAYKELKDFIFHGKVPNAAL